MAGTVEWHLGPEPIGGGGGGKEGRGDWIKDLQLFTSRDFSRLGSGGSGFRFSLDNVVLSGTANDGLRLGSKMPRTLNQWDPSTTWEPPLRRKNAALLLLCNVQMPEIEGTRSFCSIPEPEPQDKSDFHVDQIAGFRNL